MDALAIILVLVCFVAILIIGSGIFAYAAFAMPAMRTAPRLSAEDGAVCSQLIKEWKAYPFLCRSSVKRGACPCQPCEKLNAAKAKQGHG